MICSAISQAGIICASTALAPTALGSGAGEVARVSLIVVSQEVCIKSSLLQRLPTSYYECNMEEPDVGPQIWAYRYASGVPLFDTNLIILNCKKQIICGESIVNPIEHLEGKCPG